MKCKKSHIPYIVLLTVVAILFILYLLHFLIPVEGFNETILIEDSIYGKFKCFTKDDTICNSIITTHAWEKHILDKIIEHYKKDTTYLDIGCNYGCHSIGLANEIRRTNGRGKIHSFDLQPEIFKLFKENVQLNRLQDIITPHFFGLGDKNETKEFIVPVDYDQHANPGGLSLHNTVNDDNTTKEKVDIKRLDDLQMDNISLIKIDVEGYELEAFEGGKETIKRNRPVIIIEIWKMNYEKYATWIQENFPFYRIEPISHDDYVLIPAY